MTQASSGRSDRADVLGRVFLTDARNMAELADESVALVVTSPPYFNIKDYSKDGRQREAHSAKARGQIGDIPEFAVYLDELLVVWRECFRVLRPNGKLVINAPLMPMLKRDLTTHENRHIFDLNAEIQASILGGLSQLFLLDTYVWNRTNPSKRLMFGSYPYPTNFYAQNTIEFVSVFVKAGKAPTVAPDMREASRLTQEEWVTFTRQVWDIPVPNRGDLAFGTHSALMPEEIARRCIRLYSYEGDVILDPFAGSGTTLRVAKELRRRYVGYELVESYGSIIDEKVGPGTAAAPLISRREGSDGETSRGDVVVDSIEVAECLDFLERVPKGSIDLACIDPPYNLRKAEWDTWPTDQAFMEFTQTWLRAVLGTLRKGAGLVVFNTPRNAAHFLVYLESLGCLFQNWITWDKRDGFVATRRRFVPGQETIIYVTTPGAPHTFNADAVRVPYESTQRMQAAQTAGILKNGKRWFPNPAGRLCPDVWHISSERHKNKKGGRVRQAPHPTQKPFDLIERIVLATTNPGDLVLDCFAGTGTLPLAAASHGRHFLACDSNPEYVELGNRRLEALWSSPEQGVMGESPNGAGEWPEAGRGLSR